MNSEIVPHLTAERTTDRVSMSLETDQAYDTLLAESTSVSEKLSPHGYNQYLQSFLKQSQREMPELAVVYGKRNFESLDLNSDDLIQNWELDKRKVELADSDKDGELPTAIEIAMVASLQENLNSLKYESKDGSLLTLGHEPNGITVGDLTVVDSRNSKLRKQFAPRPFLANKYEVDPPADMPPSIKTLLEAGGMTFKSVPGLLKNQLKEHHGNYWTTAFASGLYSTTTNEIMTEKGEYEPKARQHEIGHFVDDSLVEGRKSFSDQPQYVEAVKQDMESLSTKIEWNLEFPEAHLFIRSGLYAGKMTAGARKEIFADLYQSRDQELACQMRNYFPNTANLIDSALSENGLDRFVSEEKTKDCSSDAAKLTS